MSQMNQNVQHPTGHYPPGTYPAFGPRPGDWRVHRTITTQEVAVEHSRGAGWKIVAIVDESIPAPRISPMTVLLALHGDGGSVTVTLDAAHALGIEVEA